MRKRSPCATFDAPHVTSVEPQQSKSTTDVPCARSSLTTSSVSRLRTTICDRHSRCAFTNRAGRRGAQHVVLSPPHSRAVTVRRVHGARDSLCVEIHFEQGRLHAAHDQLVRVARRLAHWAQLGEGRIGDRRERQAGARLQSQSGGAQRQHARLDAEDVLNGHVTVRLRHDRHGRVPLQLRPVVRSETTLESRGKVHRSDRTKRLPVHSSSSWRSKHTALMVVVDVAAEEM